MHTSRTTLACVLLNTVLETLKRASPNVKESQTPNWRGMMTNLRELGFRRSNMLSIL